MKKLTFFATIICIASVITHYLIDRKKETKFTGEWVMTEGIRDRVISDTARIRKFSPDSVKYLLYYGRTFVSWEEVQRILADHRHRAAEAINYYKNN